jgi:hypothetical protein
MSRERQVQNPEMITHTFSGLPVRRYMKAYEWYARLLGREADMFPHETEAVWRLTASGAIYVVEDPDRAGGGLLTLALEDLDGQERHLREAGLVFSNDVSGDAPRRLVVNDPDGNRLSFFQGPDHGTREG